MRQMRGIVAWDEYVMIITGLILPQVFNAVPMVEDSVALFG